MKELGKIITLILFSSVFTLVVSAQEKRTYAGFDLGVNISLPSIEKLENEYNPKKENNLIPQFRFNIIHQLSNNIFLKTGVGFILHRIDDSNASLNYLELPAQIGYKLPLSETTNIGVFGGPYFGWGVGGKIGERRETFGKSGFDVFNYGAGVGIGSEIKKFAVKFGYNHGIKDISGNYSDRAIRLRSFYITMGFNL